MLNEFAKAFPQLEGRGSFSNPFDGLQAVKEIAPDLIFTDIEMPGMSGIELLRKLKGKNVMSVFITSHPDFALEGFELQALDYVLKPLTEERFAQVAKRIYDYWELKQKATAYDVSIEQESLMIKEGHTQIRLSMNEIIYLEAMQDYTKIITAQKKYVTLTTFTALLQKLPAENFMRVHRSYAVALSKIKTLKNNEVSGDDFVLPVGKTYRAVVAQLKL